jgi:tetratricopeptide (TPR) repeat protein
MIRFLIGVLLSVAACAQAICQSSTPPAQARHADAAPIQNSKLDKADVLQLISVNETAARDGESAHADPQRIAVFYKNLGILYADAGMPLKSEDALRRAITLLQNGPRDQLAVELGELAVLHVAMNKVRQAEKEELQALQIRETVPDPLGVARAQSALGGLYDAEGKYSEGLSYAQKAYDVLADSPDVGLPDRIGVRHTLGFALTGMRDCDRGIHVLQDALELAKVDPGIGQMSVGYSEFVLGFGYWHCDDRVNAANWLERGTTDMNSDFGWDRAMYVNAMKQYARFLRQDGQQEAAVSAEAVINQAQSVVDASTLTDTAKGFRSAGSH